MNNNNNNNYAAPRLTVYGNVNNITLQNGNKVTDVPQGTPCCNNISGS